MNEIIKKDRESKLDIEESDLSLSKLMISLEKKSLGLCEANVMDIKEVRKL